jgi:hypothetical protein
MANICDWTFGENKPNQTQSWLAPRSALGVEKTKPILSFRVQRSEFSVRSPKDSHKIRKGYLKKQSQFVTSRIDVKPYLKGYYGNNLPCGVQKTNPNKPNII